MEAVGAAPVRSGGHLQGSLRDAALKRALRDAVIRVSRDLLAPEVPPTLVPHGETSLEEGEPRGPETTAGGEERSLESRLEEALGDDPRDYATRFRILEDRGERPALFVDDPLVESEYVIAVEVYVDTERVTRRLERRGFSLRPAGELEEGRIRLELLEVDGFGAYEQVRVALAADTRVRSVTPVEMERGRAVLEVDSGHQPEELLERLVQVVAENLDLELVAVEEGSLILRVHLPPQMPLVPSQLAAPGD